MGCTISVIIPVYNICGYLPRCLDSLLRQSYADFEVILIDDGSTDGTDAVCEEYAGKYENIIFAPVARTGVGGARNVGLDRAKGAYIAFVDGDDTVSECYLETLLKIISDTGADIAACDYNIVNEASVQVSTDSVCLDAAALRVLNQAELMKALFDGFLFRTVHGKLYRKNAIGGCRFDQFDFAEDMEFNSRVFQRVCKVVFTPLCLYTWVMRGQSKCNAEFSLRRLDNLYSIRKVYNSLKVENEAYAGFALKRMYKDMLILRYDAPPEYLPQVITEISETVKATQGDLFKRTSTFDYLTTMLFMRLPAMYRAFRHVMAKRAGRKKG